MPSNKKITEAFGTRVRRCREVRGWSLRDLSAKTGVAYNCISRAERGSDMWMSHAVLIAAALEVPFGDLVTEPRCRSCYDMPPPGFSCNACGSES